MATLSDHSPPTPPAASPGTPALWYEPAPRHFDQAVPCWVKALAIVLLTLVAMRFLDKRVAMFASEHPIPDLAAGQLTGDTTSVRYRGGDAGRELMLLEQWGQGVCSVVVIVAVALLDPKGRRRALSLAIACLLTMLVTHLIKDLCGRSRPFSPQVPTSADGSWIWGGPAKGFHGAIWGSFPSAHTTAAFALACGLSWFYPRGRALFMGLAVITATLRVLHTAHYLSDVIAGLGIGMLVTRWTLAGKLAGRMIALAPPQARAWWLRDA